jgi:UDP-N-acetylglucosamine diphosphorylase / glucose-1-phosphate thymidylyltransferase / UDP-N-acetylgalactosamine diphosphorylase / glucosamine-1-phosphate N-acetyltransferase / galactosamine-1-phosphate N-acetyltransferase
MKAIILAAGAGKRMGALTLEHPKPLIEVAGRPLISYVFDALPNTVNEVIVVLGYKGEMIRNYLGKEHKGRPIQYVHQWMSAGTAHALSMARPFLNEKFLLLNADDIIGAEALEEAVKYPLAILVAEHSEPEKMGVVSVRSDGTLESIIEKPEKPEGNLVSTGVLVLDERLFGYEATRHSSGEYYMTTPLASLASEHSIVVVRQPLWIPVGYPEDIPRAEELLRKIENTP